MKSGLADNAQGMLVIDFNADGVIDTRDQVFAAANDYFCKEFA